MSKYRCQFYPEGFNFQNKIYIKRKKSNKKTSGPPNIN